MHVGLLAQAWFELLYVDIVGLGGFRALHRLLGRTGIRTVERPAVAVASVTDAFHSATALYLRPVQCLQRAAVVTRLLRRRGVAAELVIGCHMAPLRAHAWVEVAGIIVSDDEPGLEHYTVVDRW